ATEGSATDFRWVTGVFAVIDVVTGVLAWRRAGRISDQRVRPADARLAGQAGALLGIGARSGSPLAGLVLVVGGLLIVGPLVALFLRTFDRELYVERQAKARLGYTD